MALESILKKAKKFGKPYLLGKIAGITLGVAVGITFGEEIYELIKQIDYNFLDKIHPSLITGYIGQGLGGHCGTAYYFLRR